MSATPAGQASQDRPLPRLREDLRIVRGGGSLSGAPTWIVLDPLRAKFFRVTFEAFQMLSLWPQAASAGDLVRRVKARFERDVEADEVEALARLLEGRHLVAASGPGDWKRLHQDAQPRHSLLMRAVHGYLFFKIPLVRPGAFLARTAPVAGFLTSRLVLLVLAFVGAAGLYLAARQWDAFLATVPHVFTLEGAAVSLAAIVVIKVLHELGHAYAAHRAGCRVSTMGVAMMVMMPLAYTDVTDAWKLRSRRQRIGIDIAGVAVEMAVAALALFLWAFVPDGPVRSALFVLAATGWAMSLAVNLNPFMRFDGYYIFADWLGIENLQPRAFELMRSRLRRLLFGIEDAAEDFGRGLNAVVLCYALATLVYRIVLYVGIALLVYHFAVKLVGILLFVVEVGFFMLRPILSELKVWWSMRAAIRASGRTRWTALAALGGLALLVLPVSTTVEATGILQPAAFARLFPSEAGRIETLSIAEGGRVRAGDVLFTIASPALDHERDLAELERRLVERRLQRSGADPQERSESGLNRSRLVSLNARLQGLDERRAALVVRAPFDGVVRDLDPEIVAGRWVSRKQHFASIEGATGALVVRGYVSESDRPRLSPAAPGRFVPDDVGRPSADVVLAEIGVSNTAEIAIPELTSRFGGPLAIRDAAGGRLSPADAVYGVTAGVVPDAARPAQTQTVTGRLVLDARPVSIADRVARRVAKVLVREMGL